MQFDRLMAISELISEEHLEADAATPASGRLVVDSLNTHQLDSLPFGAIQLDREGKILQYNRYESELARVEQSRAIGKNFFSEIAPCTNVKEFQGRFKEGVANQHLFETFKYHFPFKIEPRNVSVTLFYSKITETIWVFIRPA
jgi:photoactive yellow protein